MIDANLAELGVGLVYYIGRLLNERRSLGANGGTL